MECQKPQNLKACPCTYPGCPRKGLCCQCLQYHLENRELPACSFPKPAEATYDRRFEHFARLVNEKKI